MLEPSGEYLQKDRPNGFLLTVKTFAFQNLDHCLILNNW